MDVSKSLPQKIFLFCANFKMIIKFLLAKNMINNVFLRINKTGKICNYQNTFLHLK